jgi:hypothetical protein
VRIWVFGFGVSDFLALDLFDVFGDQVWGLGFGFRVQSLGLGVGFRFFESVRNDFKGLGFCVDDCHSDIGCFWELSLGLGSSA